MDIFHPNFTDNYFQLVVTFVLGEEIIAWHVKLQKLANSKDNMVFYLRYTQKQKINISCVGLDWCKHLTELPQSLPCSGQGCFCTVNFLWTFSPNNVGVSDGSPPCPTTTSPSNCCSIKSYLMLQSFSPSCSVSPSLPLYVSFHHMAVPPVFFLRYSNPSL